MSQHGRAQVVTILQGVNLIRDMRGALVGGKMEKRLDQVGRALTTRLGRQSWLGRPWRLFGQEMRHGFLVPRAELDFWPLGN